MKIKKWEIVLAGVFSVALVLSFVINTVRHEQQDLSSRLIRLHVIANSDSREDQSLKLAVRDSVNAYLSHKLTDCNSKDEAMEIIGENIDEVMLTAENAVSAHGYDYSVSVGLSDEYYPTREYDGFSLPAGEYTSLRINIGEASGQNWWCVVFPPICTAAVTEDSLSEMEFSDSEIKLITQDDAGVVFKFKILELLQLFETFIEN